MKEMKLSLLRGQVCICLRNYKGIFRLTHFLLLSLLPECLSFKHKSQSLQPNLLSLEMR